MKWPLLPGNLLTACVITVVKGTSLMISKKNWKGFKVCPQDYEPKEPQLEPLKYKGDAIALFEPRPDRAEPMQVYVGIVGDMAFESVGMQPAPVGKPIAAKGAVGKVTVAIS
jgi:hypothetical protein